MVNISGSASSTTKGETLLDTVRNLEAMRPTWSSSATRRRARRTSSRGTLGAAVVNAGDGTHEHPTQALLDASTIREHKGTLEGLNVAICGDIRHSRVARSNICALTKLGAHVRVAGPAHADAAEASSTLGARGPRPPRAGARGRRRRDDAAHPARAAGNGACFPSTREYSRNFGLNAARLALAKPDAIVMHPGPINRGVEIDPAVADGTASVILDQVDARRRRAHGRALPAGRRRGGGVARRNRTVSPPWIAILIDALMVAWAAGIGWLFTRRMEGRVATGGITAVLAVVAGVAGHQLVAPKARHWWTWREVHGAGMTCSGTSGQPRRTPTRSSQALEAQSSSRNARASSSLPTGSGPDAHDAFKAVGAKLVSAGLARLPGDDLSAIFGVRRALAAMSPELCDAFWTGKITQPILVDGLKRLKERDQIIWASVTAHALALEVHAVAPPPASRARRPTRRCSH